MAKFRKVHTSFWDDPLMEKLSPDNRYFYLFLMTNPLCTECGIYSITLKKMCNYTGYNEDSVKAMIKTLEVDNQRIVYDLNTEEVCILKKPNYIDRLGKPVIDCLNADFGKIKNKLLIFRQLQHIDKPELRIVYEKYTIRWQEEEEEKEEKKKKKQPDPIVDEALQIRLPLVQQMLNVWLGLNADYKSDDEDKRAVRGLAIFLADRTGIEHLTEPEIISVMEKWNRWCFFILQSRKYKNFDLPKINQFYKKEIHQELLNPSQNGTATKQSNTSDGKFAPKDTL
jgi:hypothetical protein